MTSAVAAIPDQAQRSFVEHLLRHATRHHATSKGGTGAAPSAGYYYLVTGSRRSLWSLYLKPQGPTIAINLGSIANTSPTLAQAIANKLMTAPAFADRLTTHNGVVAGKYPEFTVSTLVHDPTTINILDDALELVVSNHTPTENDKPNEH